MGSCQNTKLNGATADSFRNNFVRAISLAHEAMGEKAFRPERPLNAAVYDSVMVGLARRLDTQPAPDPLKVRASYSVLLQDKGFQGAFQRATSDEESVRTRIQLATEAFASA
jgi:hypothetical protein